MKNSQRKKLYKKVRKFAEIDLKHRFVSIHTDQTLTSDQRKLLAKMYRLGFFTQLRFFE